MWYKLRLMSEIPFSRTPEMAIAEPSPRVLDITKKLNPRQITALTHLMSGASNPAAAEQTGVSVHTVRSWLQQESFSFALNYLRAESLQHTMDSLRGAQNDSVAYLWDTVKDDNLPGTLRLRAAGKILDITAKHSHHIQITTDTDPTQGNLSDELRDLSQQDPEVAALVLALREKIEASRDSA